MKIINLFKVYFIVAALVIYSSPDTYACTVTIFPTSASFDSSGGYGSFEGDASTSPCTWYATSNDSWIVITSGVGGYHYDDATVEYTVAPNPNAIPREGAIIVGSETHTVTQSGIPSIDAYGITIGNGSSLALNDASMNMGCLNITIEDGGTLDLGSAAILQLKNLYINAGGIFIPGTGIISYCGIVSGPLELLLLE
jgi:hypothetical protein